MCGCGLLGLLRWFGCGLVDLCCGLVALVLIVCFVLCFGCFDFVVSVCLYTSVGIVVCWWLLVWFGYAGNVWVVWVCCYMVWRCRVAVMVCFGLFIVTGVIIVLARC